MDDLTGLGRIDLLQELKKAESELEDVQEMRLFTLGQTNEYCAHRFYRIKQHRAATPSDSHLDKPLQ